MKRWIVLLTLLQLGDIITTLIGGIKMEANPCMLWLWANLGFWALVVVKVIAIGLFIVVWGFLSLMPKVWLKTLFHTALVIECMVPLTVVVMWNLWCLLERV